MKNPEWYNQSLQNHNDFLARAQEKGQLTTEPEIQRFLALAISGEAGELANLFKKWWRGDDLDLSKAKDEIADVYIYLRHLACHMQFDLDERAAMKVDVVTERLNK
jgi:NTP pyrophosphatase (non-canonical NTP hydrolase)